MGRYFKAVILDPATDKTTISAAVQSWDYNCGAKLPEHAWSKNPFVLAVENLLSLADAFTNTASHGPGIMRTMNPIAGKRSTAWPSLTISNPGAGTPPTGIGTSLTIPKDCISTKRRFPPMTAGGYTPCRTLPSTAIWIRWVSTGRRLSLAPYIGAWARDIISVEETPPEGYRNLLERH